MNLDEMAFAISGKARTASTTLCGNSDIEGVRHLGSGVIGDKGGGLSSEVSSACMTWVGIGDNTRGFRSEATTGTTALPPAVLTLTLTKPVTMSDAIEEHNDSPLSLYGLIGLSVFTLAGDSHDSETQMEGCLERFLQR